VNPTINDAKKLAYSLRQKAVGILTVGDDGCLAWASYGMTGPTCRAMGKIGDQILDAIEAGRLTVPPALQPGEAPHFSE
jgi:hypothetical protein